MALARCPCSGSIYAEGGRVGVRERNLSVLLAWLTVNWPPLSLLDRRPVKGHRSWDIHLNNPPLPQKGTIYYSYLAVHDIMSWILFWLHKKNLYLFNHTIRQKYLNINKDCWKNNPNKKNNAFDLLSSMNSLSQSWAPMNSNSPTLIPTHLPKWNPSVVWFAWAALSVSLMHRVQWKGHMLPVYKP